MFSLPHLFHLPFPRRPSRRMFLISERISSPVINIFPHPVYHLRSSLLDYHFPFFGKWLEERKRSTPVASILERLRKPRWAKIPLEKPWVHSPGAPYSCVSVFFQPWMYVLNIWRWPLSIHIFISPYVTVNTRFTISHCKGHLRL